MATCKKCNQKDLEWIQLGGKYKLIDPITGLIHHSVCKMTALEYTIMKEQSACIHKILKSRFCDKCEESRDNRDGLLSR